MVDRLTSMAVFVHAAERGGLGAAARLLGISPAMATKHLRALEQRLGATLLNRTTRRRSLTEAGRAFLDRCKVVLAEVDAAERGAVASQSTPRGVLRVSAPTTFGARCLAPALIDLLAQHPELEVDLVLGDRVVNLVEEEVDVAVRIGRLADSELVARRLAPYRTWLVAAPSYLKRRGKVRRLKDLAAHDCLGFSVARGRDTWRVLGPGAVTARLRVNNGEALRQAALRGGGIILQPQILVAEDVRARRLRRVLPAWEPPPRPMHVVHLADRQRSPKLRAFVDFVVQRFGDHGGVRPPSRP